MTNDAAPTASVNEAEGAGVPRSKRRLPWLVGGIACAVVGVLVVIFGVTRITDADGDGLPNDVERAGWATVEGATYVTDPYSADSDWDGLSDADEAGEKSSGDDGSVVYEGISDPTKPDSDDDGLNDTSELRGWATSNGNVHFTDPMVPDTDHDGLTDGEEAGERRIGADDAEIYEGIANPTVADSDGDGLSDSAEVRGWRTVRGAVHATEPMVADSDNDGLTDGQEAASLESRPDGKVSYAALSDPLRADTDGDGLSDLEEADLSLDAFSNDTDADGLSDYDEVEVLGTDPMVADSDGDGLRDGYEVANADAQGLDPLWPDEQFDSAEYAWEFARGAFAGEFAPSDTLPWLAGNLAATGASFVPVVGTAVGTAADLRDSLGSAIRADWVGAGLSAASLVPYVGDVTAVTGKVQKFVERAPALAVAAGATVMALDWVPDRVKIATVTSINRHTDALANAGMDEKTMVRFQKAKVSLDAVAAAMARHGHIDAPQRHAGYFSTGQSGESYLAKLLRASETGVDAQRVFLTDGCSEVCNATARRIDVFANGVAHESKVGQVSLTESIRKQIESDAHLVEIGSIEAARWHFFASEATGKIGATVHLLDFLDSKNIPYSYHLP